MTQPKRDHIAKLRKPKVRRTLSNNLSSGAFVTAGLLADSFSASRQTTRAVLDTDLAAWVAQEAADRGWE